MKRKQLPELKESEDERIKRDIIETLRYRLACEESVLMPGATTTLKEAISWLENKGEQNLANSAKSCKDEQKPADKVEPKFHIGDRVRYKEHACDGVITEITDTDYICGNAKLPISTQDNLELVEQNHAWSEEDETVLNNLIYALANDRIGNDRDEYVSWLKSLKDRCTWKPSDEQIQALDEVYKTHGANNVCRHILLNLMNDLKKLWEE